MGIQASTGNSSKMAVKEKKCFAAFDQNRKKLLWLLK